MIKVKALLQMVHSFKYLLEATIAVELTQVALFSVGDVIITVKPVRFRLTLNNMGLYNGFGELNPRVLHE